MYFILFFGLRLWCGLDARLRWRQIFVQPLFCGAKKAKAAKGEVVSFASFVSGARHGTVHWILWMTPLVM
jgi:hypothetical protein